MGGFEMQETDAFTANCKCYYKNVKITHLVNPIVDMRGATISNLEGWKCNNIACENLKCKARLPSGKEQCWD
jgi:hypothetical protein